MKKIKIGLFIVLVFSLLFFRPPVIYADPSTVIVDEFDTLDTNVWSPIPFGSPYYSWTIDSWEGEGSWLQCQDMNGGPGTSNGWIFKSEIIPETGPFTAETKIAWDAPSHSPLYNVRLKLYAGDNRVLDVGYYDAWAGSKKLFYAYIAESTYSERIDSMLSGDAKIFVERDDTGHVQIFRDDVLFYEADCFDTITSIQLWIHDKYGSIYGGSNDAGFDYLYFNEPADAITIENVETVVDGLSVETTWTVDWGPDPQGYLVKYYWSDDSIITEEDLVETWVTDYPSYSHTVIADYLGEFWFQINASYSDGSGETTFGPQSVLVEIEGTSADNIPVYEDCFVRQLYYPDGNYNDGYLRAGEISVPPPSPPGLFEPLHTYLKFDLRGCIDLSGATLRLYCLSGSSATISCYYLENNEWSENSLTWNNAPTGTLYEITSSETQWQDWQEWDLSPWILNHENEIITLVLRLGEVDEQSAMYASKEYSIDGYDPHILLEANYIVEEQYEIIEHHQLIVPTFILYDPPGDPDGFQQFETSYSFEVELGFSVEGEFKVFGAKLEVASGIELTVLHSVTQTHITSREESGPNGDLICGNLYDQTWNVLFVKRIGYGWSDTSVKAATLLAQTWLGPVKIFRGSIPTLYPHLPPDYIPDHRDIPGMQVLPLPPAWYNLGPGVPDGWENVFDIDFSRWFSVGVGLDLSDPWGLNTLKLMFNFKLQLTVGNEYKTIVSMKNPTDMMMGYRLHSPGYMDWLVHQEISIVQTLLYWFSYYYYIPE